MKLHHLLRNTKEFVDDLRHVQGQDGLRKVKIDIKEFYMSGKPGFLSHACSELFCDETEDFQQLVAKAVDRLCRNQYVQSEFLPDPDLQSYERGMGLLHSGEVSDASFWIAAERWLLNTSVRQWCSTTYWRRFRGDIFAITSNFPRGCRCLGGQWLFRNETKRKDLLPCSSVSTVLILNMCIFRGPAALRKASDQFVSIEKNNVLLKPISWQGFRGSSRVRQQFREPDGLWLNGVHE